MTERSQPLWWWLENVQLAMWCGLIGGGGRDGTQVSFKHSLSIGGVGRPLPVGGLSLGLVC